MVFQSKFEDGRQTDVNRSFCDCDRIPVGIFRGYKHQVLERLILSLWSAISSWRIEIAGW